MTLCMYFLSRKRCYLLSGRYPSQSNRLRSHYSPNLGQSMVRKKIRSAPILALIMAGIVSASALAASYGNHPDGYHARSEGTYSGCGTSIVDYSPGGPVVVTQYTSLHFEQTWCSGPKYNLPSNTGWGANQLWGAWSDSSGGNSGNYGFVASDSWSPNVLGSNHYSASASSYPGAPYVYASGWYRNNRQAAYYTSSVNGNPLGMGLQFHYRNYDPSPAVKKTV
jgi:hypothetical protein